MLSVSKIICSISGSYMKHEYDALVE